MDKNAVLNKIKELGLLAVIRGPSPDLTLKMVDALVVGGVLGIEITYSTPNAPQVVKTLAQHFGDQIILGMGTLTEIEHAELAVNSGARFLVSPHCEKTLAEAMVDTGLPVMIGALSAQRSDAGIPLRLRCGKDLPRLAGRAWLCQSFTRALSLHPDDAHRWCRYRQYPGLVCSRGRRCRGRQQSMPDCLGKRRSISQT